MPRVNAAKPSPAPIDRAARRAVNKQINSAIHQLQLADECVHEHAPLQARKHFKEAREAIEEGVRLLKG